MNIVSMVGTNREDSLSFKYALSIKGEAWEELRQYIGLGEIESRLIKKPQVEDKKQRHINEFDNELTLIFSKPALLQPKSVHLNIIENIMLWYIPTYHGGMSGLSKLFLDSLDDDSIERLSKVEHVVIGIANNQGAWQFKECLESAFKFRNLEYNVKNIVFEGYEYNKEYVTNFVESLKKIYERNKI